LSNCALLVRTDFSDQRSWDLLRAEVATPSEGGFLANVEPVSDDMFAGADWENVKAAVPPNKGGSRIVCIADSLTVGSTEHPVLIVDLIDFNGEHLNPFRCTPAALWSVENNLNIGNMD